MGKRRVYVSTKWDAAVAGQFDAATMEKIAAALREDINNLWADSEVGHGELEGFANDTLRKLTYAAGYTGCDEQLNAFCSLPRCVIEWGREARSVAKFRKDRKWYDDRAPRIRRTRAGSRPMDIVVGDVHHCNILFTGADGRVFTPKIIAWQDWATNRVFVDVVFLRKSEAVRGEHVVAAYIAMVEAWGVPACLYLDNGSEYFWAELVADVQTLAAQFRHPIRSLQDKGDEQARWLVNALPYNGAAKIIENFFGNIERTGFSTVPGQFGGNPMKKKTANVGRAPETFQGSEEALRRELQLRIDRYNAKKQAGALVGRSPNEVFTAFVEQGWKRTVIDPKTLSTVFARTKERIVRQGSFSLDGVFYTDRALQALPPQTKVMVRVPIGRDRQVLPVLSLTGGVICYATPDQPYAALDRAGARESATRKAINRAAMRARARERKPVDWTARTESVLANQPALPVAGVGATIRLDDTSEKIGREQSDKFAQVNQLLSIPQKDREAAALERQRQEMDRFDEVYADWERRKASREASG